MISHSSSSNLVAITEESFDVILSMAYATDKNFIGHTIYPSASCYLHKTAASRLHHAIEILKPLSMKLKIWDGFRPLSAQKIMYDNLPNDKYISSPESGICSHCRGIAIDLTIVDRFGHELDMGTSFDDFRPLAHHGNAQISEKSQRNRLLLAGVMSIAGFEPLKTEWWHYQLPEASQYPLIKADDLPRDFTKQ